MIQLFDFQVQAASQIANRFARYLTNPPVRGTAKKQVVVPFYQALAAITASGKTAILAQAVSEISASWPVKPIILWLSTARVVVQQTFANIQEGGKYHHLLGNVAIRLLAEYDPHEVATEDRPLVYFATVGTFNQKDKEKGTLLIYSSDLDTADHSTWEGLKLRQTPEKTRRPLLIVYDEGHNLTDQQTGLLMELEPDAILVASATMKLPGAIAKVIDDLKEEGWKDSELTTFISPADVAESGLIKRNVLMGGYKTAMVKTVEDLLEDMKAARKDAANLGISLFPKAIYVCKTNILETDSYRKDDPKRPFSQREAPPILIWRYLAEQQGIDPSKIVVYADIKFDKNFPPPPEFILLKGGDKDYEELVRGNFEHIIFNRRLQEGWDDPAAYFAYIDKSMGSNIQVEQIIGRLLRQPGARHYESQTLNSAHFYVRVDTKGVFKEIVEKVGSSLSSEGADVEFTPYDPSSKGRPIPFEPRDAKAVPHVYIDPTQAVDPIAELIEDFPDFRGGGVNVRSTGARALVQHRVGDSAAGEIKWRPYQRNNMVSARWIFQLEVNRVFPRALEVSASDHEKFDAGVELGSKADKHIRKLANEVVEAFLQYALLRHGIHNPYRVGSVMTDPSAAENFNHALHEGYSGMNDLELGFARALDDTSHTWARNPSRSGFGIPLVSLGRTKVFYPDFLAWKGSDVFALETKGEHLLQETTNRKLLTVSPVKGKARLVVKLISKGKWNEKVEQLDSKGFTVWRLRADQTLGQTYCKDEKEAVRVSLAKS